jgi:hypothetical protein
MADACTLTIVNESQLVRPTFAVFVLLPVDSPTTVSCTTWLSRQVDRANSYAVQWDLTWGFGWSAGGTDAGRRWWGSGGLAADPTTPTGCAATLAYDGDFLLVAGSGQPDGSTLWIDDGPTLPPPDRAAASVGVTLAGSPVMSTTAGPNLGHVFTLAPANYVTVGDYRQGQAVDPALVATFQPLAYGPGTSALTATLGPSNTWSVVPGGD